MNKTIIKNCDECHKEDSINCSSGLCEGCERKNLEKFECMNCGCYFWVENRNDFECPNCKYLESMEGQ